MKKLPLGKYDFAELRREDCLYVDKTDYVYKLVTEGFYYFLSRPRRFGKSLLISTLKNLFLGKKELFKGLKIYEKEWEWKEFPVITIDFNRAKVLDAEALEEVLLSQVNMAADKYDLTLEKEESSQAFYELIAKLSEREKVVVLIDEYDKAVLNCITDKQECDKIRKVLKGFYGVIKAADEFLKFAMLTGVSKFSQVSVFSDLNNLTDITFHKSYAGMLGYTEEELLAAFSERFQEIAEANKQDYSELLTKIKKWYNGYLFCEEAVSVYNPVSVMSFAQVGKFKNYWFETGTPTFLLKLIEEYKYDVQQLEKYETGALGFSSYEPDNISIAPLLYQTGYLTIKDYEPEFDIYTLSYPNMEVKNAWLHYLNSMYTTVEKESSESYVVKLILALRKDDLDEFFKVLKVFFANVPYDIQLENEKYYQTIFYLIFTLLGLRIKAEVRTNNGRIDAVIEMDQKVYIFEFKLYESAEVAMQQIKEKKYYEKYLSFGKEIALLGVAFDKDSRNIGQWLIEPVSK